MPQYSQESMCWTLFLIKLQAFRPETLLKSGSNTGVFLWMLWIFLNSFFYATPPVTAFNKEWGKIFKWKKKMKTFHLNSTCNYVNIRTAHSFSLTFSSNFLSFDLCMLIFVFSFLINWKIYLVAFISIFRSRH